MIGEGKYGGGKYEDALTVARVQTKAKGALLIIFEGEHGHGFSAQLPPFLIEKVPGVLRDVATQIEADIAGRKLQ